MTTGAERFAAWAIGLVEVPPPVEVINASQLHLLDVVGCGVGALRKETGSEAVLISEPLSRPHMASIIGRSEGFGMGEAAFANGCLFHGLDYDDTHWPSICHTTAVVAPVALAVGEAYKRSGSDILRAVVGGTETICRIGAAARGHFHERGFHPSSVCGVFGATVTAGMLLGLDVERLVHGLGIAGSFASGLFAYLDGRSNPKPMHIGHAARDGILAAQLAAAGATGPSTVLEGRYGLYHAFLGMRMAPLDEQLDTLGARWESIVISTKSYPACHSMHACLDAASLLSQHHAIHWQNITDIEAIVSSHREANLVLEPLQLKKRPASPTAARFSLPYSMGHILVYGALNLDSYDPKRLADSRILDLADRVHYRIGSFQTTGQSLPGAVRITARDGQTFEEEVLCERGSPENPLNETEILEKFRENVGDGLSRDDADYLATALQNLSELGDLGLITSVLRRVRASEQHSKRIS